MWDVVTDTDALLGGEANLMAAPRVLVAVVTSLRDWELVQCAHWYRIPLAHAPRRLAAEYVAFYHTAAFPDLRWSITYYAPIERYDVLPRAVLLPDEPNHPHAKERYYRLALGPLLRLPRPIPSHQLRRVAFIGTTLARLLAAREINDLWEHPAPQDALRQALQTRERASVTPYQARTTISQPVIEG